MNGITITPEQLSDIARADGIHDFGADGPRDDTYKAIFDNSVPVPSRNRFDEDDCLDTVLGPNSRDRLRALLQGAGQGIPGVASIQDIPIYGGKFSLDVADASVLATNLGLQAGAALVVDFNQHGFLSKLKRGASNPIPIYYLLTPEVINDPAPKTSYKDTIFAEQTGLKVIPCIEVRNQLITFPGGIPTDDPHTKFFSKYTHALSGIRDVTYGTIPKKLVVDLTITTPTETKTIKDSKKQNSIESLKSFLTKLVQKVRDLFSATPDIATKWTQKRGGDWFQAICALDIPGREFINVLDNSKTTIPKDVPVFFVTHDRIALAYALLIGCNAIFLSTDENECYVFTRTPGRDLTQFYTDQVSKLTDLDAQIAKMNTEVNTLTEEIKARAVTIDGALNALNTEPEFRTMIEYLAGESGCLAKMTEFTHLASVLNRYQQILDALNGDSVASKFMAYLNAKDITPFDINKFRATDVYKAANTWKWDYVANRKRGEKLEAILSENVEKTDAYVFLPYIAELSNASELKHKFAQTFQVLAANIRTNQLPAFASLRDDRTREKASISIGTLAIQTYIYLRYNETSEEQRKNAELILFFSSYVPKVQPPGETIVDIHPGEVETAVLNGVASDTLSSSQVYTPLLQALNVSANHQINAVIRGGEKRKRDESETPVLNPRSPILVLMYALGACIPDLEQSPDVRTYAQYIKFIEQLTMGLNSNRKRYAVWEVLFSLNTTRQGRLAIAQALGLTPDQYRPFAMISHAFSDYLFGDFRNYDFRPAVRILQAEDIKAFLSSATQNIQASTYQDILQSYKTIRTVLGFVELSSEPSAKRLPPPGSETVEPIFKKAPAAFLPSIFGGPELPAAAPPGAEPSGGRKTYRRKLKQSTSSRRTKRAHRSDRAKESETQSSP